MHEIWRQKFGYRSDPFFTQVSKDPDQTFPNSLLISVVVQPFQGSLCFSMDPSYPSRGFVSRVNHPPHFFSQNEKYLH